MADKKLTVAADMPQRSIFATPQEAEQFLAASGGRYEDFGNQDFAAPGVGVNDAGEPFLDPALYSPESGVETMVAVLRKRGAADKVHAIVVAPIPTLDALMADENGRKFVQAIIHKELNHRAVKALREAEDVSSVVDQIPTTLTGYITSTRDTGGLLEAFNELYKTINATMSAKVPHWAKRRFIKSELRRAMESKGYAADIYPELEDAGKNGSLFEVALRLGINAAKKKGLDPTIFERWLETRATKVYEPGEEDDELELDLDDLTEEMLSDDSEATADEPETEPETGESEDGNGEATGEDADQPTT